MNIRDLASNILQKSEDFADVLSACRTLLKHHSLAEKTREYLDNRISSHYQDVFGFGYFPNNENINILTDLVPENKLRNLGLLYNKKTNDSDCMININVGFLNHHNLIIINSIFSLSQDFSFSFIFIWMFLYWMRTI